MLSFLLSLGTLLVLSSASPTPTPTQDTELCPSLADSPAVLALFPDLKDEFYDFVRDIGRPMDSCLASMNAATLVESLREAMDTEECKGASEYVSSASLAKLLASMDSAVNNEKDITSFMVAIHDLSETFFHDYCDATVNYLTPCFLEKIVPVVDSYLRSQTNGCCDTLLETFDSTFGYNQIADLAVQIFKVSNNVVCGVRSEPIDGAEHGYCGHIIAKSLFPANISEEVPPMQNFLQLGRNESCAAFTGKEFNNSVGKLVSLTENSHPALDSCGVYLIDAINFIGNLPFSNSIYLNKIPFTSAIEDESCQQVELFNFDVCLKLPSHVDESCEFGTTTTDVELESYETSTSDPTPTVTIEPTVEPTPESASQSTPEAKSDIKAEETTPPNSGSMASSRPSTYFMLIAGAFAALYSTL